MARAGNARLHRHEKFVTGENSDALLRARPLPMGDAVPQKQLPNCAAPVIDKTGGDIILHADGDQTVLQGFAVAQSHKCGHNQNKDTRSEPSKELVFSQHFLLRRLKSTECIMTQIMS